MQRDSYTVRSEESQDEKTRGNHQRRIREKTHHAQSYTHACSHVGENLLGFLIGSVKQLEDGPVFYVDLVCSAHRKGKDLLARAEIKALSMGMRTITLRAASPRLLNVYRRRGYTREVDACRRKTREQRRKLRDMDKVASALFQGKREEWRTSGDGWWMSKCCAKKSNVDQLKQYIQSQPDKLQLRRAMNRGIRRLFH